MIELGNSAYALLTSGVNWGGSDFWPFFLHFFFSKVFFQRQMYHLSLKTRHLPSVRLHLNLIQSENGDELARPSAVPSVHAGMSAGIPCDPAREGPPVQNAWIGLCHMCTQRMNMNYTSGCEQRAVAVLRRLSGGEGIRLKSAAL